LAERDGWSARNQLISLSSPAGSATFKYDAMGRRTEKTVNGQTTGFLYDGAQAIAELRGGSIDTVYHTGVAIDEVLARYGSSGNKTLLTDALMSVIAQTNDAQNADNFYAYSPYGEVAVLGPDGGNDLQYGGLRNDGTGLYQATYRYYDPVLKQWISEDPIGLLGGINQRAYSNGAPTMYFDPLGLDATVCLYPADGGPYGHIGIGINSSSTQGLYPRESSVRALFGTPGEVKADTSKAEQCKTIKTSADDDRRMSDFLARVKANPGSYGFTGNNCTNLVRLTLQQANISTPGMPGPRPYFQALPGK
jgi:RHS repeat-associated protein